MRRVALFVALVWLGCGGGSEERVDTRCERVRDHLVTLSVADASHVDRDTHAAAMRRALGSAFVARCATSMTEAQRACVLEARSAAAAAACSKR